LTITGVLISQVRTLDIPPNSSQEPKSESIQERLIVRFAA